MTWPRELSDEERRFAEVTLKWAERLAAKEFVPDAAVDIEQQLTRRTTYLDLGLRALEDKKVLHELCPALRTYSGGGVPELVDLMVGALYVPALGGGIALPAQPALFAALAVLIANTGAERICAKLPDQA